MDSLEVFEQEFFPPEPGAESRERIVAANNSVAGHYDEQFIGMAGLCYCAVRVRISYPLRNLLVAPHLAEGDLHELLPHLDLELRAIETDVVQEGELLL